MWLSLTLRILPQLFEIAPKAASQYCVQTYPAIQIQNVESCLGTKGKTPNLKVYLKYLSSLMAGPLRTDEEFQNGGKKRSSLTLHWFECNLLYSSPPSHLLFATSSPRHPCLGAHKISWKHQEKLMAMIKECTEPLSNTPHHLHIERNQTILYEHDFSWKLQKLCEKYGFFPGLRVLLKFHHQIFEAIDLAVYTDDLFSILSLMEDNPNPNEWEYLLTMMWNVVNEEKRGGNKNDVELEISIDVVVSLMVLCLGPIASMQLLMQFKDKEFIENVSPQIYGAILRSGRNTLIERRALVHELLSTIDSYLWSRRPPAINPQLRALVEAELAQSEELSSLPFIQLAPSMPQMETDLAGRAGISPTSPYSLSFDPSTILTTLTPTFYEESGGHFGVETELTSGICPICTLPIMENPEAMLAGGLSSGPTVVIFPKCGHAFHQFCVGSLQACTLCFASNAP